MPFGAVSGPNTARGSLPDLDRLPIDELTHTLQCEFAAVTRVIDAAEGNSRVGLDELGDGDTADVGLPGQSLAAVAIGLLALADRPLAPIRTGLGRPLEGPLNVRLGVCLDCRRSLTGSGSTDTTTDRTAIVGISTPPNEFVRRNKSAPRLRVRMPDITSIEGLEEAPHAEVFEEHSPRTVRLQLAADERVPKHCHPESDVVLSVRSGAIELTLGDEVYDLESGDVVQFDGD